MTKKPSTGARRAPRRRTRKHGYRGYGSEASRADSFGGTIHWGRGFHGVEIPGTGRTSLPAPILFERDAREKPKD